MIVCVVGARPNFVKMAPVIAALKARHMPVKLIHTGQHYDRLMSDLFFEELNLPVPDVCLDVGRLPAAAQTGLLMERFEKACRNLKPELVIVAGDVNSTMACAVASSRMRIPLAHIESGLRSFDRNMIEEINRIVTDHLSDYLFVTERSAQKNLRAEGIDERRVFFTGNTMIDTLLKYRQEACARKPWRKYEKEAGNYALATLHRSENVDDQKTLAEIFFGLGQIARFIPVLFPVHPRTRIRMKSLNVEAPEGVLLVEPAGYLDFLGLLAESRMVLTDSGGVQEESTVLGVPCLTLRGSTERPVTVEYGTNSVCGSKPADFVAAARRAAESAYAGPGNAPELWEGRAGERIADILVEKLAASAESRTGGRLILKGENT